MAPHRARLDTNRDGRVIAEEYARTAWMGRAFTAADSDADGDLSATELLFLYYAQPPTDFDGKREAAVKPAPPGSEQPAGSRDVWEVLVWIGDTLRAAGDVAPSETAVDAAVASGRLDSRESRLVLGPMRELWESHGWVWPEGLP